MRWLLLCLLLGCTEENPGADDPVDGGADALAIDGQVEDPDGARPGDALLEDARAGDARIEDAGPTGPDARPDAAGPDAARVDVGPGCTPTPETCDGTDEDCDGRIDNGFGVGAPCVVGIGLCAGEGVVVCAEGDSVCQGESSAPAEEICNGLDDDCDGQVDEELPVAPCYAGPEGTEGVGRCLAGSRTCVGGEQVCLDEVRPRAEQCDGSDADCDGEIDEGCEGCGDGRVAPGEQCDDGNRESGDGCAANCRLEGSGAGLIPGIQRDLPLATIEARGFRLCHSSVYRQGGERLDDLLGGCPGTQLLIGCHERGSNVLRVAAEGLWEEVTRDVGGGRGEVNPHNGVDFYFSRGASWGFAPLGAGVNRNTCDTADLESEERMCWHTQNDSLRGGWRCGALNRLSDSDQVERMVYARTEFPLGAGRGFGHHGDCDSFNGCIDAAGCAQAACEHLGRGEAVSWREGGCQDAALDCDLFASVPDELDTEWAAACNMPAAYDVICRGEPPRCGDGRLDAGETCDDGNEESGDGCSERCREEVPIEAFEGVLQDVDLDGLALGGFQVCHVETYGTVLDLEAVQAACLGEHWVVGCRPAGADTLTLAAMGVQETILTPVPAEANAFQVHNGAHWYYSPDHSFGFVPLGEAVNRQPCDTNQGRAAERLCWHTRDFGGWRCGATTGLNQSMEWERVVLSELGF